LWLALDGHFSYARQIYQGQVHDFFRVDDHRDRFIRDAFLPSSKLGRLVFYLLSDLIEVSELLSLNVAELRIFIIYS